MQNPHPGNDLKAKAIEAIQGLIEGILEKAKDKIQGGLNDMDSLVGVRTRAIQRKLRSVESLEAGESRNLLDMEL